VSVFCSALVSSRWHPAIRHGHRMYLHRRCWTPSCRNSARNCRRRRFLFRRRRPMRATGNVCQMQRARMVTFVRFPAREHSRSWSILEAARQSNREKLLVRINRIHGRRRRRDTRVSSRRSLRRGASARRCPDRMEAAASKASAHLMNSLNGGIRLFLGSKQATKIKPPNLGGAGHARPRSRMEQHLAAHSRPEAEFDRPRLDRRPRRPGRLLLVLLEGTKPQRPFQSPYHPADARRLSLHAWRRIPSPGLLCRRHDRFSSAAPLDLTAACPLNTSTPSKFPSSCFQLRASGRSKWATSSLASSNSALERRWPSEIAADTGSFRPVRRSLDRVQSNPVEPHRSGDETSRMSNPVDIDLTYLETWSRRTARQPWAVLVLGGTKHLLAGDYSRADVERVARQEFARWERRGGKTDRAVSTAASHRPTSTHIEPAAPFAPRLCFRGHTDGPTVSRGLDASAKPRLAWW